MLKSIRLWLVVVLSLMALLAASTAFAARGDGGRRGGEYRGGHVGTYYRGGERHGGYYRGGEHHGGYYGGRHGHYRGDFDFVIGGDWGPWWGYGWPYYYSYYYPSYYYPSYPSYPYYPYYYAPSATIPGGSQTYIEREEPGSSSSVSTEWPEDWFYCPESKSYYPYVKECPGGWKTVSARPPSESGKVRPSESSAPSGVWYYCPDSRMYYPYVQKCPGGWKTVPAKPAAGPER